MPIVYTPTVGLGCQQFSRNFRKPRGLFLSFPLKDRISHILSNPRFDNAEAIVVSDGERIFGLGDQGAGGMGIPIGKLSLYTACAGVHPSTTLPVLLDVGTDNRALLDDPLYVGWRQERVRGRDYDNFIAAFVDAVRGRWPHILLHWEDFALANANRLLATYREQLCTFNDDIQGTAAIAVGAILSAIDVTGLPIEQRIAVLGAGTAGTGICALLVRAMPGAGLTEGLESGKMIGRWVFLAMARTMGSEKACGWPDVPMSTVGRALATTSGNPIGSSDDRYHSAMRSHFLRKKSPETAAALSYPQSTNPAGQRDRTGFARPFTWSIWNGRPRRMIVFPGVGLGAIAIRARHISEGMFLAAARAIADLSPAKRDPHANLLTPLVESRAISA